MIFGKKLFDNLMPTIARTRSELEQLYNQLTWETKQKLKIEGKGVTDTGGGRYVHTHYSQEEEQLTALLKNRIVGDGSVYDNDNGK